MSAVPEWTSTFAHWARLFLGGICLPLVFPYVVYKLYKLSWGTLKTGCLQDKVVLVTGASSGLGEAIAHRFYDAGCKVILASRRLDELERVKNDMIASSQNRTRNAPATLRLDLADLEGIPEVARRALDVHGKIDVLINNGGIGYRGEVLETDVEVDVRVMMVNYFGQVALTKALLPSMVQRKEGSVVAISSVQGKIAIPFRSAYAASKHATQAFYDCLRAEVTDSGVHVCVVSPGYVRTDLSLNALTGTGSTYGVMDEATATGTDPAEVAEKVVEAVVDGRSEVVVATCLPRLVIYLRLLFPWLYFAIMSSRAKRLRRRQPRT